MDDLSFPFVVENLMNNKDKNELLNLVKPSTNFIEDWDWVYLEAKKGKLRFPVGKDKIDQAWKKIRKETKQGKLGVEAYSSTSKKSKDEHRIYVYTKDSQDKEDMVRVKQRLSELGFEAKVG